MKLILIFLISCMSYAQIAEDKQLHMVAGTITSIVGYTVTYEITKNKTASTVVGIGLTGLVAHLKETHDRKTTGYSNPDFRYTMNTGIFVTLTLNILTKKNNN